MKNKISIIVIILLLIICLIGIIFVSTNDKDDTKKEENSVVKNTNKGITKDQKFQNLDFTSTSLSYVKGTGSTFKVKVTNNTTSIINIEAIDIILKDKDGKVITTLYAYLGGNIEPEQENLVRTTSKDDLSKAYTVEYRVSTQ